MTLENFLKALNGTKTITIHLYDENDLLLIDFGHPGYNSLDDNLLLRIIEKFEINTLTAITIKLAAAGS